MSKEITGVILAGGKNSRMGSEKGLLSVDGDRIIERIIHVIEPLVDEIFIISNTENYNYLGLSVYSDIVGDCGPLGGIYTALKNSKTEYNLIIACDMPFLSTNVLNYLISHTGSNQIIVPHFEGNLEPLCAIYHSSCTSRIMEHIQNRQFKLLDAINSFDCKIVEIDAKKYGEDCFRNINTRLEYQNLNRTRSENAN